MKNRSADATILGFYYQFDATIQKILKEADENCQITIEGIEDVDIKTVTDETAIQFKYQAETNGTDSILRKPIKLMLEHYKKNQSQNLTYLLYGHYKNNATVDTSFNFSRIKKMMIYTENKIKHDFLQENNISQSEVKSFIAKFKLVLSKPFDEHQKDTFSKIKSEMNVSTEEEANFLYCNALKILNDLAIQKNITKRKITKKDFKKSINTKNTLFTIWFIELKGIEAYCKANHRRYFKSSLNETKKERFFILPNDSINNLKNIIYTIEEKFYKTTNRDIKSGAPYIVIKGISKQDLIDLKNSIYNESKTISDGVPFLGAKFQVKEITKASTKENQISIKILHESQLKDTLFNMQSTKEIYQFYIDKKDVISTIDSTTIQINECKNISLIIKGSS